MIGSHPYEESRLDPGWCKCGLSKDHPDHIAPAPAIPAAEVETQLRSNILALLKEVGSWASCKSPDCLASCYWVQTRTGKVLYDEDGTPHNKRCKARAAFRKGA